MDTAELLDATYAVRIAYGTADARTTVVYYCASLARAVELRYHLISQGLEPSLHQIPSACPTTCHLAQPLHAALP